MLDYILQPNLPAYCIEDFLKSIKDIKIDRIISGGSLESFIDFIFLQKKFTVHWDVDQWIFYTNDDSARLQLTYLIDCIEAQNKNKFNNFIILFKRKMLFL